MKKIIISVLASFLLFEVGAQRPENITIVEVSSKSVSFEASGGEKILTVTTNAASWSLSNGDKGWCSARKSGNSIIVTCHPNTNTSERSANFQVNAGDQSVTVHIKQKAKTTRSNPSGSFETSDANRLQIIKVAFAEADILNSNISDYGATLYDTASFIKPKITYNNLAQNAKTISLVYKIKRPDGTLMTSLQSSHGYTSHPQEIRLEGKRITMVEEELLSCGSNDKNAYASAGRYTFEIWCSSQQLFAAYFEIKRTKQITALEKGDWKNTIAIVMHNATQNYVNGKYKGEMSNGNRNGLGVRFWTDNSTWYWGNWSNDQKTGSGLFIVEKDGDRVPKCPKCKYYAGGWSFDQKNGKGKCYDKTGKMIYSGNFKNDQPPTEADSQAIPDDFEYKFECIEDEQGNTYLGETYRGAPHGLGVYCESNGDAWYGEWNEGKKRKGITLFYDGKVLEIEFILEPLNLNKTNLYEKNNNWKRFRKQR